jgi:hypothetical protein
MQTDLVDLNARRGGPNERRHMKKSSALLSKQSVAIPETSVYPRVVCA